MVNQRSYTRLETDIFANMYESTENKEIPCKVRNISEYGICFEAPKDAPCINLLHKGDGLAFQFVDSFRINDKVETDVLSEKSVIRHVTENKDGILFDKGNPEKLADSILAGEHASLASLTRDELMELVSGKA